MILPADVRDVLDAVDADDLADRRDQAKEAWAEWFECVVCGRMTADVDPSRECGQCYLEDDVAYERRTDL